MTGSSHGKRHRYFVDGHVEEGHTHGGQTAPIEVKSPLGRVIHVVVASENATKVSSVHAALLCSVVTPVTSEKCRSGRFRRNFRR
jgi:prepilin-type processing-associated H-X9-DG protein